MSRASERRHKARFPVGRIKRIMQMDEDVGKVAQATPLLVSKAVELFMHSLIDEACKEVHRSGAKRMTAVHLKRCVENTEQFDFLKDIVEKIPDPTEDVAQGSGRRPRSAGVASSAFISDPMSARVGPSSNHGASPSGPVSPT